MATFSRKIFSRKGIPVYCPLCNTPCAHEEALKDHLVGRKHGLAFVIDSCPPDVHLRDHTIALRSELDGNLDKRNTMLSGSYASVLQLQLKRFEFDSNIKQLIKSGRGYLPEEVIDDLLDQLIGKLELESRSDTKQNADNDFEVHIVREKDIRRHLEHNQSSSKLADFDKVGKVKVSGARKLCHFKEQMADRLGNDVENQVWWAWAQNHNGFQSLGALLNEEYEPDALSDLSFEQSQNPGHLYLFLMGLGLASKTLELSKQHTANTLCCLFVKEYFPRGAKIEYVGCMVFVKFAKLKTLITSLGEGSKTNKELEYIIFQDNEAGVKELNKEQDFESQDLYSGSTLIVQKILSAERAATVQHPTVDSFLDNARSRASLGV